MEKLSCDRRVKCRTVSSSLTSGSRGRVVRRSFAGRSSQAAAPESRGHWSSAPRPRTEYSKMGFSSRLDMMLLPQPARAELLQHGRRRTIERDGLLVEGRPAEEAPHARNADERADELARARM